MLNTPNRVWYIISGIFAVLLIGILVFGQGSTGLFQGKLDFSTLKLKELRKTELQKKLNTNLSKFNLDIDKEIKRIENGMRLPTMTIKDSIKLISSTEYINEQIQRYLERATEQQFFPPNGSLDLEERGFTLPDLEAYITEYSIFEDCTNENEAWCHNETNKQLIKQVLNDRQTPINVGNYRVCLEGNNATSTTIEKISFYFQSNYNNKGAITINGRRNGDINFIAYSTNTFDLPNPIELAANNCLDVELELEGNRNENLKYFKVYLDSIQTSNNLTLKKDIYSGNGGFTVFKPEELVTVYRNNYNQEIISVGRTNDINFGGFNFCTYDERFGDINSFTFNITQDNNQPLNVIVEQTYYNNTTNRFNQTSEEITINGSSGTLSLPALKPNLTHSECNSINFRATNVPEEVTTLQVTLTSLNKADTTQVSVSENNNFPFPELALPFAHAPYQIVEAQANNYTQIYLNAPFPGSEPRFTRNGTGQDCFDSDFGEVTPEDICPRISISTHANLEDDFGSTPNRLVMSMTSNGLETFPLNLYMLYNRQIVANSTFTITPGRNLINWNLAEAIPSPNQTYRQYRIVGFPEFPTGYPESDDTFYDIGELQITLEELSNNLFNYETNQVEDPIQSYVYGPSTPGGNDYSDFNSLPYQTNPLLIDQPKGLISSTSVGTRNISLSELTDEQNGQLQLFTGSLEPLTNNLEVKSITFLHNINKQTIPGETLQLRLGRNSIVPTEWVPNQSVTFEFPDNRSAFINGSDFLELVLVNPTEDISDNGRIPTVFQLTEINILSEEDRFRPDNSFPVNLITGFEIDPDTLELLPVAFRSLSGPLFFFRP